MKYKVGLDIGITSVGWAAIELNDNDEPLRIIDLNSRIFDAAENPKDGSSLSAPRREARGARRRLRRHRHRLERIRNLIVSKGVLTQKELDKLFVGNLSDIYEIRVNALSKKLTNDELARLLIHFAQRRGFKSNRKSESKEKDAGKLLTAVAKNKSLIKEKGYKTVGEMLYYDERFKACKRNKTEDYSHTISRDLVEEEVRLIFNIQRQFNNLNAKEDIENKYLEILLSQRPFDLGPGGNSPYGGDQIEKMIGKCTFEKDKKRAAKASYSFEYFTLLQNVNNIRITSPTEIRILTNDERNAVIELAHKTTDFTYTRIRKILNLSDDELFGALNYGKKTIEEVEKAKFNYLKAYHEIRKTLDKVSKDKIKEFSREQLNAIGTALSVYKTDNKLKQGLLESKIDDESIEALLELSFSKFGHLSIEACEKIIPYLENGLRYDEACEKAGYNFRGHDSKKKIILDARNEQLNDITNPVVRRAISQTIKVINNIIRKYGSPCMLSIELAREMSKPFDERKKLEKDMKENQASNEKYIEKLKEYGVKNPTGMDIVKLKLWEEQGGICPYSLKSLHIENLFDIGYCDVDHIIPYSICFDDGYKNKVLVYAEENRQKGNRLPMQYLTGAKKEKFVVWVNNNIKDAKKKQRMLKEKLSEEEIKNFKERNLNDTKYISKFIYNFINDNLIFAPLNTSKKKRVTAVNGAVTSYMRKRWGVSKFRTDGDLHHAVDAAVVACITDGMIARVSRYSNYREMRYVQGENTEMAIDRRTGEIKYNFPLPWEGFRDELEARLSIEPKEIISKLKLPSYLYTDIHDIKPVFVSRMPKHKASGAAHKDTIKSPKILDSGYVVVKKSLKELKLNADGEIEGYYRPQDDRLLYELLKSRLAAYNGNAEKAFIEKVYKPTASGKQGAEVKKVKIMEKSTLNVSVHKGKGAADNDSMVRIDIFYIENEGYYFVPIYLADTIKDKLPNKACVANKPYGQWAEMDDKYFIFSLYPNDLIKVVHKNEMKMSLANKQSTLPKEKIVNEHLFYYVKAGISVASIMVINHDKTYKIDNLGIKSLKSIEKYQIDVLGEYHKVGKEKRQGFKNKGNKNGLSECFDY